MTTGFGFRLLAIFASAHFALGFVPDPLRHMFVSSHSDDSTHSSITENGIKKAVREYFVQKNPKGAAESSAGAGADSELDYRVNFFDLFRLGNDPGLRDVFRIRYGRDCALQLAGYYSALRDISTANGATDSDSSMKHRADFHFDADKFHESNANVIAMREAATKAMAEKRIGDARTAIGHALHILQDFYSHSNWVEMGRTEPSHGLGSVRGFELPVAADSTPTCGHCPEGDDCKDNILVKDELTSGFFRSGFPGDPAESDAEGNAVIKPTIGKCSHGGLLDLSARDLNGGINKDTADPNASPHWYLHRDAANLAEKATADFLTSFRREIGDESFEEFLALAQPQCQGQRSKRSLTDEAKPAQKVTLYTMADTLPHRAHIIHDQFVSRHPVVISAATGPRDEPFSIRIDRTTEDFIVKVIPLDGGSSEGVLVLRSPSNITSMFNASFANGSVTFVNVQAPEPGVWKLEIESESADRTYFVTVLGISTWDTILNVMAMDGRGRHVMKPSLRAVRPDEILAPGSLIYVYIMAPIENANVTHLSLRGLDGRLIRKVPVSEPSVDDGFARYLVEVNVPDVQFRLVVLGKDSGGFVVEREPETVFTPKAPQRGPEATAPSLHEPDDSILVIEPKSKNHDDYFALDNLGLSVASLTCLIFLFWLLAILAVILLKMCYDKCRHSNKDTTTTIANSAVDDRMV